jgi:CheY-like chemotaxis protein
LLRELLGNAGFTVSEAVNGKEAIEQFESWHPHAILMDWFMPILGGAEATRRIKQTERGRHTPIICVTASALDGTREEALAFEVDAILTKPFRLRDVLEALNRTLQLPFQNADESSPASLAKSAATLTPVSVPADLTEEHRSRLRSAATTCSHRALLELADDLDGSHHEFSATLKDLAGQSRYDLVVQLLDAA